MAVSSPKLPYNGTQDENTSMKGRRAVLHDTVCAGCTRWVRSEVASSTEVVRNSAGHGDSSDADQGFDSILK